MTTKAIFPTGPAPTLIEVEVAQLAQSVFTGGGSETTLDSKKFEIHLDSKAKWLVVVRKGPQGKKFYVPLTNVKAFFVKEII